MSGSSSRRRKRQSATLTFSNAKNNYISITVINPDFSGSRGNTLGAVLFEEDGTNPDGTLTSANGVAGIVTKINSNAILKTYLRATLIQETTANNIDFTSGYGAGDVIKFSGGAG